MAKQLFDYSGYSPTDYIYYGFHLKDGRYHIDTKRLKKIGAKGSFPEALFSTPRNTHYFIPKHKHSSEYAIVCLRECLNRLSKDWHCEYKDVISKLTTPREVFEKTRVGELMFTSSADDLDCIEFDALLASVEREKKYCEVVKSIHLQYLQKMFAEFFRAIYLVIKDRGYKNTNDFSFKSFFYYVQESLNVQSKEANPLYKMPHYKYFDALNKIDNFLKHNSRQSYLSLANNPFEKDPVIKEFLASFVFGDQEEGLRYESGMYAGDWLKIDSSFVDETIANLQEFSKEFCQTVFGEDADESFWNSDEALLKILKDNFFDFM